MPANKKYEIFKSAARPGRERGRETRKTLRRVAIALFAEHGYQNVSLRMLAQHIGIQAGSIYNHISNKAEFLFLLLQSIMEELQVEIDEATLQCEVPREKLEAFVRAHVMFHATNRDAVFIGNMELRNLNPEHLAQILDMRRSYESQFTDVLAAAAIDAGLEIEDPRFLARTALAMLNNVASWFTPKGPLQAEVVSERFVLLVNRMVGLPTDSLG